MALRPDTPPALGLLADEVNRLLRELLRSEGVLRDVDAPDLPPVDIHETAQEIVVRIELPGVDPAGVSISFEQGKLTVEGVKTEQREEGRLSYLCVERSFGRFRRVITLPNPVNTRNCRADYRLGIVTISLPKVFEKRGERIDIPLADTTDPENARGD